MITFACAVGLAGALAGCATAPAPPISAKQLAYARSFNLFTVYWAGKRMDGIPLTEADGLGDYVAPIGVSMFYGNCLHQSLLKLGGCTLPLKITTVWYVPHSNRSLGPQRSVRLHGVPALIFNHGDEVELYTDAMAVDVIGATPKLTMEGVRHLTTLTAARAPRGRRSRHRSTPRVSRCANSRPSSAARAARTARTTRPATCSPA